MNKEEKAFIKMVEISTGTINSLCHAYYRVPQDAEDARQEVILQLWKSYKTFRQESALTTWVYRVALNTVLNRRRRENRIVVNSLEETHSFIPTATTDAEDELQILHNLLDALSDVDKGMMILILEGYKYAEIADMLGVSATSVSTKVYRIKTFLSNYVANGKYEY